MNENIGSRVRELRKQKKMTLNEVSIKSGLSISFLSQLELSKSSVTLTSLRKIAESLNVNISYFFESNESELNIKRRINRKEHTFKDASFSLANLSGDVDDHLFEPTIATLLPGDKNRSPYSHEGQEFIYILEGILTVILSGQETLLYPGDSLHIESLTPHVWYNNSENPVKLLMINAPVRER